MPDSDPHLSQDPLDECLKSARWPAASALERTRLEARWDSLARERARSRRRLARWMLAATVLLAAGIGWGGWLLLPPRQQNVIPPVPQFTEPQLADNPEPKKELPGSSEPMVRPPTKYEQTAFNFIVHREQQARINRRPDPLVRVLHQTLNEPEADLARLCEPLRAQRSGYENWILARLGSWNADEQRAALKILQEIGSPRTIPVLDRLSRDPEFAKPAWPVALHLAPANLLGQWARTMDAEHRKQAIQTLVSRSQDAQALGEFLRLVASPDTRKVSLEVIQAEPAPPVEALFAVLKQGTTKEERHTAGLVLGRLATPEITKKLLALAKAEHFPPEVMIALLNSSDKDAERFLNQAKHDPQARTAVQLARLEWELISYASSLPKPLEIH